MYLLKSKPFLSVLIERDKLSSAFSHRGDLVCRESSVDSQRMLQYKLKLYRLSKLIANWSLFQKSLSSLPNISLL